MTPYYAGMDTYEIVILDFGDIHILLTHYTDYHGDYDLPNAKIKINDFTLSLADIKEIAKDDVMLLTDNEEWKRVYNKSKEKLHQNIIKKAFE